KYMLYRKEVGIVVLATTTTIAIQCPQCGELEFQALSLFAFSRQGRINLTCQCGANLLAVASLNRKEFSLAFNCAFCGQTHYIRLNRRLIWSKDVLPLMCHEVEAAVGFMGPKQKVAQSCQEREKSIAELATELGYEEEFENPEVMLRLLDHLHYLSKNGALGCSCGNNHLAFELLPDRIELYCESCEALGIIYADNADKIRPVEGMTSIFLEENKTWLINRLVRGQHLAKANEEE
ncbi:MAG: hypothetical protein ACYCV0_10165, partial [Desulfitobacteriaceae bacterium]